jgi:hypothetical protein
MIIPEYWAEARLRHRDRRRRIAVHRFGWSDIDQAAAQAHAQTRAAEAMARLLAGEDLPRRERRVAYNGAEGVPIREEIVARHGDSVVTRTGYGAPCLNTPDVLFADIDFAETSRPRHVLASMLLLFAIVAGVSVAMFGIPVPGALVIAFFASLLLGVPLPGALRRAATALRGGRERVALERVRRFVRAREGWRLRVYRTPAGLRLMATHRRFAPRDPDVRACFDALGVDPLYARMCFRQDCFRARVGPKPWRMGMPRLRAPYSAAWRPEHAVLPARQAWIGEYEDRSRGYAACRYLETVGNGEEDLAIAEVCVLHDDLCRAERDLPIA